MTIKLNIGSGKNKNQGFINVDLDRNNEPDCIADAVKLPFRDNSSDIIEAIHLVEHINRWEVESVLKDWIRVLKVGGKLILECPNIEFASKWVVKESNYYLWSSNYGIISFYGDSRYENSKMNHRWGYTPETLSSLLRRAGLYKIKQSRPKWHFPDRDMRLEAIKPDKSIKNNNQLIFWFLYGDNSVASSRLQGYLINKYLQNSYEINEIILHPTFPIKDIPWYGKEIYDVARVCRKGIVVIQKLKGDRVNLFIRQLQEIGAIVIYAQCDYQENNLTAMLCDHIVCPSHYLSSIFRKKGKAVSTIPDPVEQWIERSEISALNKKNIKLVWVGNKDKWDTLNKIRNILKSRYFSDFQLVTISDHKDADIEWDLLTIKEKIIDCDIGIIPTKDEIGFKVKSTNRITLFFALGIPVIADSIPSYEELIRNKVNGYICNNEEEWRIALTDLRNPKRRKEIALRAYDDIIEKYHISKVADKWIRLFQNLLVYDDIEFVQIKNDTKREIKTLRRLIVIANLRFLKIMFCRKKYIIALKITFGILKNTINYSIVLKFLFCKSSYRIKRMLGMKYYKFNGYTRK